MKKYIIIALCSFLCFAHNLYAAGNVVPGDNTKTIGTATKPFGSIYVGNIYSPKVLNMAGKSTRYQAIGTGGDYVGEMGPAAMTPGTSYLLRDPASGPSVANSTKVYGPAFMGSGSPLDDPYIHNGTWLEVAAASGGTITSPTITWDTSKPWRSISIHPQLFKMDGTYCATVTNAQIASGPRIWYTSCSDTATGTIDIQTAMPDNWAGGQIFVEPYIFSTQTLPAGIILFEASAMALPNNGLFTAVFGGATNILFDSTIHADTTVTILNTVYHTKHTAAMTITGAGGDLLIVRLQRMATSVLDTSVQAISVVMVKIYYQIDALSEKD